MQDYIDAQEGGPGHGWFRIVTSPAEARDVIRAGKMAVVLGIETSNLFDCFLVPAPQSIPPAREADVVATLDRYYDRGVRAIFPVHKYDNAFSAGDGHKSVHRARQLHPDRALRQLHDRTATARADRLRSRAPWSSRRLNLPRDDYFAPPPNDFIELASRTIRSDTVVPFLPQLLVPPIPAAERLPDARA